MKKMSKKALKEWGIFFLVTGLTMIAIAAFFKNVVQYSAIIGPSMEPNYYDGEIVLINKMDYDTPEDIKRFDVLVFLEEDTYTYLIKRVYGLPGETIQIDENGAVLINGEVLPDSYKMGETEPGIAKEAITLGENEFFMLGDNRENSDDSRKEYIGVVTFDDIVGKVTKKVVENKPE